MAIYLYTPAKQISEPDTRKIVTNKSQAAFVKKNGKKRLYWFLLTTLLQAVLFLPLPLVLIYFYNASAIVLIVTCGLFLLTLVRTFLVQVCAR
jgi:hypothetical protein